MLTKENEATNQGAMADEDRAIFQLHGGTLDRFFPILSPNASHVLS